MKSIAEARPTLGPRVQLGSGRKAVPGWITVDIAVTHDPDLVADLAIHWPFRDRSVALLQMEHVLEHLPEPSHVLAECYRILLPGGVVQITAPHASSPFAVADPTHRRFFNGLSLDFFCIPGQVRSLPGTYDHKLRLFEMVSRRYTFGGVLGLPVWRLLGLERLAGMFPLAFEKWFAPWFPFGGCDVTWCLRRPAP